MPRRALRWTDPQGNSGGWDAFFAQPSGALARRVSQLLPATEYEIRVTSKAITGLIQIWGVNVLNAPA